MFLWKAGVHLVASQLSVQLNKNRIMKLPGKVPAWQPVLAGTVTSSAFNIVSMQLPPNLYS